MSREYNHSYINVNNYSCFTENNLSCINCDMKYGERLKAARDHAELSQTELGEKVGVTQANISKLEIGQANGSEYTVQFALVCGVDPEWLATGKGKMTKEHYYTPDSSINIGLDNKNINVESIAIDIKRCPLISWVRAGELCDVGHVYTKDDAEEWLICGVQHGSRTFALRVVGDSMAPDYQEGWHIFVDPDIQARHNDDVIVRDETGNATFKRLQITQEGQFLLALNTDYPNRIINVPKGSTICGVVIYSGKSRKNKI